MTFDWQTTGVLAIVGAASVYLARVLWHSVIRRRAAACGSCGTCPAGQTNGQPQVVEIGQFSATPQNGRSEANGL
ncbi:MAG: hypothetical protein AB7O59_11950 [Pirellulales bacterium]